MNSQFEKAPAADKIESFLGSVFPDGELAELRKAVQFGRISFITCVEIRPMEPVADKQEGG